MRMNCAMRICMCLVTWSALRGATNDMNALATPGTDAARTALRHAISVAYNGKAADQQALRQQLKEKLRQAVTASSIRNLAGSLAPLCDDECVGMLIQRIPWTTDERMVSAICQSVQLFITSQPLLAPATRKYAADQLQSLALDETRGKSVSSAAYMAIAGLGSDGFDRLTALYGMEHSRRLDEIYFTALAETGDPRALPLLAAALKDPGTTEGRQTQIVRGLGVVFRSARASGIVLPETERRAAADLLRGILAAQRSDQSYESALQSLAVIDSSDPLLQASVRESLASPKSSRREAALQVIHEAQELPEEALVAYIATMSVSDQSDAVKANASAVVNKVNVLRQ